MTGSCAWCGAPLSGAQVRRRRLICAACGAATTHPSPTDAELEAAYGSWYRPESGRFGIGDAVLKRSRAALARRIDAVSPAGKVVDVGAGDGTLVDALRARGRDAIGLERGAQADGQRIVDAEIDVLEGAYAAVVFWHSLEHLRAPRKALRDAARILRPGGIAFVAVPNAASLQARAFGDDWLALDLPRHLVHLPAATLVEGLEEDGWAVERISHWRGGQVVFGWVHGLTGALPGDLDLYQSIRAPDARSHGVSGAQRGAALTAGVLLSPVALAAAATEVALRRGGTVYVEARRG